MKLRNRWPFKYVQEATCEYVPSGMSIEGLMGHMKKGTIIVAWARPVSAEERDACERFEDRHGDMCPRCLEQWRAGQKVKAMLSPHEFDSVEAARSGLGANHFAFDPELSGLVFHEWVERGLIHGW